MKTVKRDNHRELWLVGLVWLIGMIGLAYGGVVYLWRGDSVAEETSNQGWYICLQAANMIGILSILSCLGLIMVFVIKRFNEIDERMEAMLEKIRHLVKGQPSHPEPTPIVKQEGANKRDTAVKKPTRTKTPAPTLPTITPTPSGKKPPNAQVAPTTTASATPVVAAATNKPAPPATAPPALVESPPVPLHFYADGPALNSAPPTESKAPPPPPAPPTPVESPPIPVQLYINEQNLGAGQLSTFTEQTPKYLQFYVDEQDLNPDQTLYSDQVQLFINEQDLIAEPPFASDQHVAAERYSEPEPVPEPPSVAVQTAVIERIPESEAPAVPEAPTIPEPVPVPESPLVADQPFKAEQTPEPEPPPRVKPPVNPVPPIMNDTTPDIAEPSDQTPPAEHEAKLLVSIDLEKDHATAPESDSPYVRLGESLNQLRADNPCPVVVISALKPAAISPRFAVNLALSLAVKKLRVLLIEAEHSTGDLAAIFEAAEKPGFFEWRRGAVWASRVITETMLEGLSFMAAGEPLAEQGDNQSDLSKEAHRWSNLRRSYDTILLYGPGSLTTAPKTPHQPAGSQLLDLADAVVSLTRPAPDAESKKAPAFVSAHLGVPGQIRRIEELLKPRRAQLLGLIALL